MASHKLCLLQSWVWQFFFGDEVWNTFDQYAQNYRVWSIENLHDCKDLQPEKIGVAVSWKQTYSSNKLKNDKVYSFIIYQFVQFWILLFESIPNTNIWFPNMEYD